MQTEFLAKQSTIAPAGSGMTERQKFWIDSKCRNPKILMVDDDEGLRIIYRNMMAGFDVDVFMAETGEEALKWFNKESFDFVFLDLVLPGMSGKQLMQTMKTLKPRQRIAVVSGHLDERIIYDVREVGFCAFVVKPDFFTVDYIRDMLETFGLHLRPANGKEKTS